MEQYEWYDTRLGSAADSSCTKDLNCLVRQTRERTESHEVGPCWFVYSMLLSLFPPHDSSFLGRGRHERRS